MKTGKQALAGWQYILLFAGLGLIATQAAHAQDAMEEIVVKGYAGSLMRALQEKRNADSLVDAISAEDIGKMPAENVAEALQRVPGVAISRERGEGLFITVRGLGPEFNTTMVNGRTVAVNEYVASGGQTGRNFRFDVFASELVSGITVVKTPTADMDEGSIGGTINVKTARPLDYSENRFTTSVSGSYSDLAEEWDPRLSVLGSWINDDGTFGVLGSVAYSERKLRQDLFLSFDWERVPGTPTGLDLNQDGTIDVAPNEDAYKPGTTRNGWFLDNRERIGGSLALQWRPSDTFSANVDVMFSRFDVDSSSSSSEHWLNQGNLVPGSQFTIDENNTVLSGTIAGANVRSEQELEPVRNDHYIAGLNLEWLLDQWTISADVTTSAATSEFYDMPRRVIGGTNTEVFFDFSTGNVMPDIYAPTADTNNPDDLLGVTLQSFARTSDDEDTSFQVDFTRELSGAFTAVKFGLKYRDRERDFARFTRNFGGAGAYDPSAVWPGETIDPSLHLTQNPIGDYMSGFGGDFRRQWIYFDYDAVWDAYTPLEGALFLYPPSNPADLLGSFVIGESTAAAYVRLDFESEWGRLPVSGNFGLRYYDTDQDSNGYANSGSGAIPVSFTKNYDGILPSANLAMELTDDLVLRLAASRVMTPPTLTSIAPGFTVEPSQLSGRGGNPFLEPFEADQFDVSLEWYFQPEAALTFAYFYKDIFSFITSETVPIEVFGDGDIYNVNTKVNGEGAKINGFEVAYQQVFTGLPSPFDGLGVQANYTYIDSDAKFTIGGTTITNSVEGLSPDNINLVAFYEKAGFEFRVGYNYRSDYLSSISGPLANPQYVGSYENVDLHASYMFNDNFEIFAEALNVTDEYLERYTVVPNRLTGVEVWGRRYFFGFRYTM